MARCSQLTKKGRPCPIEADRVGPHGYPVCHVQDPGGVYQRQNRKELPRHRAEAEVRALGVELTERLEHDGRDEPCPFDPD